MYPSCATPVAFTAAITCDPLAKITVNVTTTGTKEYRLDVGDWQTTYAFTDVLYGKHTVSVKVTNGSTVCYGTKIFAETDFDACGKLNCDGIVIVAKDDANNETNTIPRGTNKTLKTLNLSAASLDGADLSKGVTYLWERRAITPDGLGQFVAFSSTQAAVSIGVPGRYTLKMVRGTTTCTTEIAINAKPCTETPDPTGAVVCTTPALTAVADEAANRLTNLASGDVVRCGDFNIIIVSATGNANGWNGKGYVKVPYLNAHVSIILKNAVFNDCYQLTNANAETEPTVYTEYDPQWGNILNVDELINDVLNAFQSLKDIIKNYKGTPQEKQQIDNELQKIQNYLNNSNYLTNAERSNIQTKFNTLSTDWGTVKSCNNPNLRIQTTLGGCDIATIETELDELIPLVDDVLFRIIQKFAQETTQEKAISYANTVGLTSKSDASKRCWFVGSLGFAHELLSTIDVRTMTDEAKTLIVQTFKRIIDTGFNPTDGCGLLVVTGNVEKAWECLYKIVEPVDLTVNEIKTFVNLVYNCNCPDLICDNQVEADKCAYARGQLTGFMVTVLTPIVAAKALKAVRVIRGLSIEGRTIKNIASQLKNTPVSGWKNLTATLFSNESLIVKEIDIISEQFLIDNIKAFRDKLPNKIAGESIKKSGNAAFAKANIGGLGKSEYYAHSKIENLITEFPEITPAPSSQIFGWFTIDAIPRNFDTEYKILSDIANRLGNNVCATGDIILFTERNACQSCRSVVRQFQNRYPKIKIKIVHNNGKVIKP